MQPKPLLSWSIAFGIVLGMAAAQAKPLEIHRIFSSNMVIQRDKPIAIWGWAEPGQKVSVQLGSEKTEAAAVGENGRWEATFPARPVDAAGLKLVVVSGDKTITLDNILIGDVWVMNGQSNMAFPLGKISGGDMESAMANLPLVREIHIDPNESETLQTQIPDAVVKGWTVCDPKTVGQFSAIGYVFASHLQRALQVPIGIIDNARGGASIESLVPRQMFKKDPLAARYLESVEKRMAEFDPAKQIEENWQKQLARAKAKGVAEDKLPQKPAADSLTSWQIPGKSPSDAAACYNGMFGVFKGLNLKGVLFHQGYNNAIESNCRPKRYRTLLKLMVEGWREDFKDPQLPVGVIEFCAGSIPQTEDNFEIWGHSSGAYIREAQRLGLADLNDPAHTEFITGHDEQIPGLHPVKKAIHGVRAARWALNEVYGMKMNWDSATLLTAKRDGDRMVLTFDKPVFPDDQSMIPKGFAIADSSGKFYMARAAYPITKDAGVWSTANKGNDATKVIVWSPLVKEPVAVRYAWATSPMGNLKVGGAPWLPLHSFRTDTWDWPESEDPAVTPGAESKALAAEAVKLCEFRKTEEAKLAVGILERVNTLGLNAAGVVQPEKPKSGKE